MQSADSKRLRKIALTVIAITTLLVLASGVSCAVITPKPENPSPGRNGPNRWCDVCHDSSAGDISMQLYVFVPGNPGMSDYLAAEKLLKGDSSTAMGFSSRGCLPSAAVTPRSLDLTVDAGVLNGYVSVFQAGPPPPRIGSGTDSAPPPPEPPPPGTEPHPCQPPAGTTPGGYKACAEPVGADGILQPDGVVYFKAMTGKMNDYRFVPCLYAHEKQTRSYDDVTAKLTADQWIHFTGTHSGKGPTWSVTRQP